MQRLLYKVLVFISVATLLTGLGQVLFAPFVLTVVGAESDKTSAHFFAIIGMFMFLFGGMLLQALRSREGNLVPVFWSGLQKLGAALAVGLGVFNGVFSSLALGVAGFDLLSGVLIFIYWRHLKAMPVPPVKAKA